MALAWRSLVKIDAATGAHLLTSCFVVSHDIQGFLPEWIVGDAGFPFRGTVIRRLSLNTRVDLH